MDVESKHLLKRVIRGIHPDLLGDNPAQRKINTDALAVSIQSPQVTAFSVLNLKSL